MDFSTLMQQASANQQYTEKRYDEIKRTHKEEEIRQKIKEQHQRERAKRKIEAVLAEEKARKIKPQPLVPPSESEHSTTRKPHANSNDKKEKSSVKTASLSSGHKTVPPVSIKGHASKHKGTSSSNASSQQAGSTTKQQLAPKPLDFKQLMKIANDNKNGNKSKELVQQVLSSNKKSTAPAVNEKAPKATVPKPVKRVEQACAKQPKSAVSAKPASTDHKRLPNSRSTSTALPQQKAPPSTTSKQVCRTGNKTDTKPPSVKLKTGSFYQSSAIGSEWSDMKKAMRRPQMQQCRNNFNISGSWINELGLTRLPTNLDSDYEDDDDLSDFVASDDDGIGEGNMEDYSAAIRDIFGYDRRKFCDDSMEVMESSYSQQQFEEKRSARIGKQEDDEDIRRELEEMKRKKCKKVKLK